VHLIDVLLLVCLTVSLTALTFRAFGRAARSRHRRAALAVVIVTELAVNLAWVLAFHGTNRFMLAVNLLISSSTYFAFRPRPTAPAGVTGPGGDVTE
jgi:hypothetical protein